MPELGRWLTNDPIGERGGFNLYNFVQNNPLSFADPFGLYGTNSCSYYEKRCEETGVDYYCKTAPKYCNKFPQYPDPDPSKDDDYEGWARCTRQCLQDCDAENAPDTCNDDVDEFWDKVNFQCHVKCYTECGAGKFTGDNPY